MSESVLLMFHSGAFLVAQTCRESVCSMKDLVSIPGSGRSSGERNGYPLQYSCLENAMDRGAWWDTVHGVAKSQTGLTNTFTLGFPGGSDGKESACNAGAEGSVAGLGRSPGEGNGFPLQYSCLKNSMDRGVWWAAVHGVAKSWTQLSINYFDWSILFNVEGKNNYFTL